MRVEPLSRAYKAQDPCSAELAAGIKYEAWSFTGSCNSSVFILNMKWQELKPQRAVRSISIDKEPLPLPLGIKTWNYKQKLTASAMHFWRDMPQVALYREAFLQSKDRQPPEQL